MPTSDSEVLRRALAEAAWTQWTTLGVLGSTSLRESRCIDLEALVWLTFISDAADARLVDIACDWLASNSHLVSVHRLRNIFGTEKDALERVMAALRGNVERPTPRFKTAAKTKAPDPMIPANLVIRLRHLLDAGVRSEVVRYLITLPGQSADAQAVADAAMFAKRNVSETLLSLARARVVDEFWLGNRRVFSVDEARWCSFLGIEPAAVPAHVPWTKLFRTANAMLEWLEADKRATETAYMRASGARTLLTMGEPDLIASGIGTSAAMRTPGEESLVPFGALVERVAEVVSPQDVTAVNDV